MYIRQIAVSNGRRGGLIGELCILDSHQYQMGGGVGLLGSYVCLKDSSIKWEEGWVNYKPYLLAYLLGVRIINGLFKHHS